MLYCVAGGNHAENGFLLDITASKLESCMNNNYFSAAYAAKSMLDIWTSQDVLGSTSGPYPRRRKLIFVNSAAAFVSLPGSIAYSRAFPPLFVLFSFLFVRPFSLAPCNCPVKV